MKIRKSKIQNPWTIVLMVVGALVWLLSSALVATAGYSDSAHGDSSNGVNRSGTEYPIGSCSHCHDPFDDSTCGVNQLMLFNSQFVNQKSGVCMKCHQETASSQEGGVLNNYDYSRVRGGETDKDCPASIRRQFWFIKYDTRLPRIYCDTPSATGSAHDLKDIRAYMKNKWGWGGTNPEVNPCGTCHNPHKATEDYPCSVPSSHGDTWQIWGDESGEKMADYVGGYIYQPPYKVGKTTYERDAATQPDYNTLCLECHQYALPSFRHTDNLHNGYVHAINWGASGDAHGKATGDQSWVYLNPPYEDINKGNYVLSCTDCHEPHGSRNEWLLRTEVNGTSGIEINMSANSYDFCKACHDPESISRYMGTGGCSGVACHGHGNWF